MFGDHDNFVFFSANTKTLRAKKTPPKNTRTLNIYDFLLVLIVFTLFYQIQFVDSMFCTLFNTLLSLSNKSRYVDTCIT